MQARIYIYIITYIYIVTYIYNYIYRYILHRGAFVDTLPPHPDVLALWPAGLCTAVHVEIMKDCQSYCDKGKVLEIIAAQSI